ncbi:MAG TPA: hypothetical protein V6C81_09855 [Planktothrix sp.]|jgi:hypothetical protein
MNGATANLESFTPKPSKAVPLWLGILAVVLVALFFETQHPQPGGDNFFIHTNDGGTGAEVVIDGKKMGVVRGAQGVEMPGGGFWAHLPRGRHVVQVSKAGDKPVSKEINMRTEEYMGVDLNGARD